MDTPIVLFLLVFVCPGRILENIPTMGIIYIAYSGQCHAIDFVLLDSILSCVCYIGKVHEPPCPDDSNVPTNISTSISTLGHYDCERAHVDGLLTKLNSSLSEIVEWKAQSSRTIVHFPESIFSGVSETITPPTPPLRLKSAYLLRCSILIVNLPLAPQLEILHLGENYIAEANVNWSFFVKLRYVNLSHNLIDDLSTFSLYQLDDLQVLDMSHNLIRKFSMCLPKLIELRLSNNTLDEISYPHCEHLHSNNPLQELHLQDNYITSSAVTFTMCTNLRFLNLSNNRILDVAALSLHQLAALEVLDLSHNHLVTIGGDCCWRVKELRLSHNLVDSWTYVDDAALELLYLDNNQMATVTLKNLTRIREVYIQHNRLTRVNIDCNPRLFQLNISHNNIADIRLETNPNLQRVHLSHNLLVDILPNVATLRWFEYLDLSYNQIHDVNILDLFLENRNSLRIDFSGNQIASMGNIQDTNVYALLTRIRENSPLRIRISRNPLNCDDSNLFWVLQNYIAIDYSDVVCTHPERLSGHQFADLRPDQLWRTFTTGCPLLCECQFETHTGRMTVNCTGTHRTKVPSIPTAAEIANTIPAPIRPKSLSAQLILDRNRLTRLPDVTDKASMPPGYEYVDRLSVNNNSITAISREHIPDAMTALSVENNRITNIDYSDMPRTLSYLSINGNPIACDCTFQQMVLKHDFAKSCANGSPITNEMRKACAATTPNQLLAIGIAVLVSMGVAVAIVICVIYRRATSRMKALFRSSDSHYKYDVFLCYQHRDERFVVDEIMFQLEREPPPNKMFVFERNSLGGLQIAQAIVETVASSRRMVFVLTHNFLDSRWTRMEFLLAHKRALAEQRTRVIIVLCDDPNELMQDRRMYEELRLYLKKGAYCKWGEPHFWKRLRAAIDITHR